MSAPSPPGPQRSAFVSKLLNQFHRPEGALGHLAGWILANRKSNRERNLWTLGLLDIQPADRVLELGCGPGFALAAMSQLAPEGLVVGLDHSATILAQARRRNAAAIAKGRALLVEASLEALPRFDPPFDKALAVNSLMFAEDSGAVLRALRERMRSRGLVAVTHQSRKPGATNEDSLRAAEALGEQLAAAGFGSIRVETLPLEPVCAACVLAEAP
jgi:SAM-dependent methyltransferase